MEVFNRTEGAAALLEQEMLPAAGESSGRGEENKRGGGDARAGARRGGAGRGGARAAAQRGCCGTRARSGAITEGGGALVRTVEGGEQSILEIRTTVPSRPIKAARGEIGVPSPPIVLPRPTYLG